MLALLLAACAPDPMPLPSEAAAAQLDREALPPLYRKLYDYAFLPEVQRSEQRVRLLIWLRHMDFNRYQLGLLQELATRVDRERGAVEEAQRAIVEREEPAVGAVYDRLWEALNRGAPDTELAVIGEGLDAVRGREADLLALRSRSVRTIFELEEPLLRTLSPQQEAMFADATFLLRHRLDPYANPGDFNALIGTIYYAGEFGALSKSTFDPNEDHLNIGGLWSEDAGEVAQARFPDARREVILYMVLLEPALPEAIEAAMALRQKAGATEPAPRRAADPAPGRPTEPPPAAPGEPGAPTPGVPADPAPGIPPPR